MSKPDFKQYDLADLDFDLLDPGIRMTVEWLVDMGFETMSSGDGTHKGQWLEDGAYSPQAHVYITVPKEDLIAESDRLHKLLIFHHRIIAEEATLTQEEPHIQAVYDPSDDSAIIGLYGVDDTMLFEPACRAAALAQDIPTPPAEDDNIEDAEIIAETPVAETPEATC